MITVCPLCDYVLNDSNKNISIPMGACPGCGAAINAPLIGRLAVAESAIRKRELARIEAEATISIGAYKISGNSSGVIIHKYRTYDMGAQAYGRYTLDFVAAPNVSIQSIKNISEKLLDKFVRDRDWHRLEKIQTIL